MEYFLNVATEPANWQPVLDVAIKYPHMFASVGLHPSDACEQEPDESVLSHSACHPKIIAIGETGLDYFHIHITKSYNKNGFDVIFV